MDALEQRFGNPRAVDNPLGFHAILAADERGVPFTVGELAYREIDAGDPTTGDDRPDLVVELLRVVGRRDLSLALRYGANADISGAVVPAVSVASLDTCLRATLRHTLRRRLYGVPVADLPAVRSVLVGAFVELLVSDALCLAAIRAARLIPSERTVIEAAAAQNACTALLGSVERLSEVMGAYFYIREGDHAIFQKHLSDLRQIILADPALPALHMTLLASLGSFARDDPSILAPPPMLSLVHPPVPMTVPDPAPGPTGGRRLAAFVTLALDAIAGERDSPGLAAALSALADELGMLANAGPPTADASGNDQPDALERADRFASLLAAASCTGVWLNNPLDPFLSSPSWLLLALDRLSPRDSRPRPAALAEAEAEVRTELLARHGQSRSFGLADTVLPDSS